MVTATTTEIRARQNFPRDIRSRPLEEIRSGQTFRGGSSRVSAQELRGVSARRDAERTSQALSTAKTNQSKDLAQIRIDSLRQLRIDTNSQRRGLDRNQLLDLEKDFRNKSQSINSNFFQSLKDIKGASNVSQLGSLSQTLLPQTLASDRDIQAGKLLKQQEQLRRGLKFVTEGPAIFGGKTIVERFEEKSIERQGREPNRLEQFLEDNRISKEDQKILNTIDKAFNVASEPFLIAGEQAEKLPPVKRLKTKFPILETEVSREAGKELISSVLKFGFFAPAFGTGAVKKGKTEAKQVVIKKNKSKDKKKAKKTAETLDDIFTGTNIKAQNKFVEKVIEKYKNNPKKLREARAILEKFGKQNVDRAFNSVIRDKFKIIPVDKLSKVRVRTGEVQKLRGQAQPSEFQGKGLQFEFSPELTRVTDLSQAVRTGSLLNTGERSKLRNEARVNQALAKNQLRIFLSKLKPLDRQKFIQANKNLFKTGQGFVSATALGSQSALAQSSSQVSSQQQRFDQVQKNSQNTQQLLRQQQQTRQTQKYRTLTQQQQRQLLRQQRRTRLRLRRTQIRKLKRFRKFPLPFGSTTKKTFVKKKPFSIKGKFDAISFKKNKKVILNRKPFSTRKRATDFGLRRVDNTLRASLKVVRSERKGLSSKIPKPVGSVVRKKFRLSRSKARAGFLIEKRKHRLGLSESKIIQSKRKRKL